MLFHVRRHEDTFSIQFALLDWDKVSGNDFIGSSTIPLADLISDAPKPDEKTGLYGPKEDGKHEMKEFRVSLWSVSMTTRLTLCAATDYHAQGRAMGDQTLTAPQSQVSIT